ncbi:MAG: hypothetical protein IPK80_13210 [Nannocystis sp.]|nr:hypothetical protein [Nannocystis sp.]
MADLTTVQRSSAPRQTAAAMPVPATMTPVSEEELREARHYWAMTIVAGLVVAAVVMAFVELFVWAVGQHRGPSAGMAPQCREEDPASCADGQFCRGGRCVAAPLVAGLVCQDGDTCGVPGARCECNSPMSCVDKTCVAPPSEPPICDDVDVQALLGEVGRQCEGSLKDCPDEDLKKFVISSKAFDEVVAKFPDTISVHFPDGTPSPGDSSWPTKEVKDYYQASLASERLKRAMQGAKIVLTIARSSKGGSPDDNLKYSRTRSEIVHKALIAAAGSVAERDRMESKLKSLLLGDRKLLNPQYFSRSLSQRIYAWSKSEEESLRSDLSRFDKLSRSEKARVERLLNQVVIIVPLPCELPRPGSR